MVKEILATFYDLLNSTVDGKIDEYEINIETDKLKGENFLGDIIFVSLQHKKNNDELHLIVKKAIDFQNFSYLDTTYPTEINFYEKIWPTLNKFQEASSVSFDKIPKSFASCKTKGKETILLEDLNAKNFKMFDKTKTLEHQHLEYIFKCYGKFHAISYAFQKLHPEEFSRLASMSNKKGFGETEEDNSEGTMLFIRSLEEMRCLFDQNNEESLLKTFDELLTVIENGAYKKIINYDCDIKVLLHGDCWSNNMMFKYDKNGKVIDMRLLDFQLVNCGSPVRDLSYCFYAGASKESLDKLEDLQILYIDTFNETLDRFDCKLEKPYTLEALKSEWKRLALFGFFLSMYLLRIKLVDKNYIPKITDAGFAPIAEQHIDTYNERAKSLILHFCENRYFEIDL